jgi:hypothetical protein
MKRVSLALVGFLLSVSINADSSALTRIQFQRGATGAVWSGVIRDGHKNFVLRLGKGQSLKVGGDDVYTWYAMAPSGERLGCNGANYCPPGEEISSLPGSGDYVIATYYRMSSCASCPVAKTRQVTVIFEAT